MISFQSIDHIQRDAELVYNELITSNRTRIRSIPDPEFELYRTTMSSKIGVYAVFVDSKLYYIGKTKNALARFREHFAKCSPKTKSIIDKIRVLLNQGAKVELAFCEVPQVLYSAIEEVLLATRLTTANKRKS